MKTKRTDVETVLSIFPEASPALLEIAAAADAAGSDPETIFVAEMLTAIAQMVEALGCTCGVADRVRADRDRRTP